MKKLPEKLNGNSLAKYVAIQEGGKHQMPIGQVKEVIKIIAVAFVQRPFEMIALMKRLGSK